MLNMANVGGKSPAFKLKQAVTIIFWRAMSISLDKSKNYSFCCQTLAIKVNLWYYGCQILFVIWHETQPWQAVWRCLSSFSLQDYEIAAWGGLTKMAAEWTICSNKDFGVFTQ